MLIRFDHPLARRTYAARHTRRPDGCGATHEHVGGWHRVGHPVGTTVLASEGASSYDAEAMPTSQPSEGTTSGSTIDDHGVDDLGAADHGVDAVLASLTSGIRAALALDHDELSDPQLQATITTVQRSYDQLAMLRASLVGTLQARAAARAPKHRKLAGEREGTRFMRDELNMTPGEAKQTSEAGSQLQNNDRTRRAWQAGDVGQAHAAVIGRALRQVDDEHRDDLEAELIEAAGRMDAVALGRLARRRVGELSPTEAVRSDRHRHLRRRASVRQDEHGDVIVSGSFSGTAGETIMASWRAFYDKPTGKDSRTHEQRAADAFEAMANAALRSGDAPTQHGERPHVLVVVRQEDLLRGAGMAQLAQTGPVPVASIGHLLRDSVMTHIGVDCNDAPIAVTSRVRNVPVGLWRALVARDGGCTWAGCSAPVGWCDVAHGEDPYRTGGRLSPSNSALLCRTHHRRFDHGRWEISVQGSEVTFRHPGGPPGPNGSDPPKPEEPGDGRGPAEPDVPGGGRGPVEPDEYGAGPVPPEPDEHGAGPVPPAPDEPADGSESWPVPYEPDDRGPPTENGPNRGALGGDRSHDADDDDRPDPDTPQLF